MTKLMEQLVAEASMLPDEEQDVLAACWISDMRRDQISPELREELDRRLKDFEEHPDDVLTWDQVQEHIRQRFGT